MMKICEKNERKYERSIEASSRGKIVEGVRRYALSYRTVEESEDDDASVQIGNDGEDALPEESVGGGEV